MNSRARLYQAAAWVCYGIGFIPFALGLLLSAPFSEAGSALERKASRAALN